MIFRVWKAETTAAQAPAYRAFLTGTIFPQLRELAGFLGGELLFDPEGDRVRVMVQTRWTSLDAIRAFAGEDLSAARVEPEARAVLSRFDDRVSHYQLAAEVAA